MLWPLGKSRTQEHSIKYSAVLSFPPEICISYLIDQLIRYRFFQHGRTKKIKIATG